MASISKINGQYRIRYYLHTPDGQKLERNRRAHKKGIANEVKSLADILESRTKRQEYSADDVKLWLREEIISKKDAQALNRRTNATKTLEQAADEWRSTWGNISTQERKTRNARIERILQILGAETEIGQITYLDAERLKNTLSQMQVHTHLSKGTKPLKARTINRHLGDLRAIFKIQLAQQAITHYPFTLLKNLKIPTHEEIEPTVLTMEQIQQVISAAEKQDQKSHRPPLGGHLTLYLLVLFGCGIRRKEAMNARLENINWQNRTLELKITKTGKPRTIGLGTKLYNLLLPKRGQTGPILPPYSATNISEVISRHFAKCGIKMRLHDTRHTYATRLLDLGINKRLAATRTGHTTEQMLNHYDHPEAPEIYEDDFEFMHDKKSS
jgi:integrase